jgi:outer membrane protein assembly factor BamD
MLRYFSFLLIVLFILGCSKKDEPIYTPSERTNPFQIYSEGMKAMKQNDYFFANKKFEEAELNFTDVNLAAKSAIMSIFCLYGINFYGEAIDNLERYFKLYPSDKYLIYAHYLETIIYFEQISDEKRDLKPLIKSLEKINFFLEKYPNTDYALDLKFKKDLIRNQLAAKEMFVAKHYIETQKWIPAISRLKKIIQDYEKTIFVEEALFRLVEIHYYLGLEDEAQQYANLLGYNYNSSEWYKSAYKIFNKKYKFPSIQNKEKKKKSFLNKIIENINLN